MRIKLRINRGIFNLCVVYNPSVHTTPECTELLEKYMGSIGNSPTFIIGDFNVDISNNGIISDQFLSRLATYGYGTK